MGVGDTLSKEVQAWGTLTIVIVVISIILLKIKTNTGPTICAAGGGSLGNQTAWNASLEICCFNNASTGCAAGNSTPGLVSTVDTFVAALSEPKNWVAIVIIAVIGFYLLRYFKSKKN